MNAELTDTIKVLSITVATFCIGLKNKILTSFLVEFITSNFKAETFFVELIVQLITAISLSLGCLYTLVRLIVFVRDNFNNNKPNK